VFTFTCRGPRLWALLLAALPGPARPASPEPIPWQDAAPLAVPFLQLPFESPETLAPGEARTALRLVYSNSIARAQSVDVTVDYQVETAQPIASLRLGLGHGLELHLEASALFEYGGVLNPAIRRVESWLGTENKLRRHPLPATSHFRILRPDGRGTSIDGSDAGVGDPWLGVKGRLREQDGPLPALAWRAALKLPAGRFPYGSGVLEEGGGLLGRWQLGGTSVALAADLMVPDGTVSPARLRTRPHPAFQVALGQELGPRFALLLQGSTHGSALQYIHMSEVDGWTFYVLVGLRAQASEHLSVGFALVENLVVTERGTDIAALLDLGWRF